MSKTLFEKHIELCYPGAKEVRMRKGSKSMNIDYGDFTITLSQLASDAVGVTYTDKQGSVDLSTLYGIAEFSDKEYGAQIKSAFPQNISDVIGASEMAVTSFPVRNSEPYLYSEEGSHSEDSRPHFHFDVHGGYGGIRVGYSDDTNDFYTGDFIEDTINGGYIGFLFFGQKEQETASETMRNVKKHANKVDILQWGIDNYYQLYVALMKIARGYNTVQEAVDYVDWLWSSEHSGSSSDSRKSVRARAKAREIYLKKLAASIWS